MTDTAFVWQRSPEPSWVAALAQVAPRNDRIPWLHLFWEPGEPWEPVQRWEIRELDPALQYLDPELLAAYEGPHPRTMGHWEGTGATRRWRGDCLVSLRQWELFREFQCSSRRVWMVQGPNGGHPFVLTGAERAFQRALGLSDGDTPAPGALPYADPDARTWARLAEYDKLRKWQDRITWDQRRVTTTAAGLYVRRDLTREYHAFGHAMLRFFTDGMKEAIDSVPRGTLQQLYDASPKRDAPPHDEDAIEEAFVTAAPVLTERTD